MLKSSLCNFSNAYVCVKGIITITGGLAAAGEAGKRLDKKNKCVIMI